MDPLNANENIEVLDIEKGEIIKVVPVSESILKEAQKHLQGITGMYEKVNAFPDNGYMIRIPFKPNVNVNNPLLNDYGIRSVDKLFFYCVSRRLLI